MLSVDKINELQAENEKLIEQFQIESLSHVLTGEKIYRSVIMNKLKSLIERIECIADSYTEKGLEPQSVEIQLKLRGKEELAGVILDVIHKGMANI